MGQEAPTMQNPSLCYPSLSQAAAALGITAKTLRRWIEADRLKAEKKLNGSYAIPVSEVERLKAEGHQQG